MKPYLYASAFEMSDGTMTASSTPEAILPTQILHMEPGERPNEASIECTLMTTIGSAPGIYCRIAGPFDQNVRLWGEALEGSQPRHLEEITTHLADISLSVDKVDTAIVRK